LYRPRSLSEIEHEFKEKVGRGRRENAPKTVHHRRIASGISSLIYYLLTILLVVTAWVYAQNGRLFLGEYKMHSVLSGSMESVYPQGSLFFTKEVDVQELVVGNDIAFHRDATSTIVHRIVQIYEVSHESGQRLFITKGVNNEREDDAPVPAGNVVGKVVFFIPHIGKLFKNINNNFNYIVIFFVAGILFSFFLNMTIGETNRERRIRKAKKILKEDIKQVV
jgi:signal peptidase I, archaeal type